mmetsp:Transcript_6763/g.9834  ORF Transcript_6763/g.9834 Transcript_6763/m.9834 type:complete len:575 (+) Transcript_6763:30-1754(+)
MKNCPEWILAEHAAYCLGAATVPFYDTLGSDVVQFILRHTNLQTVICSRAQLPAIVEAKKSGQCPHCHHIILVDGVTPAAARIASGSHLILHSFAKVEATGVHALSTASSESDYYHNAPKGCDIATFCYTSGTTGDPKGALISHTNLVSMMAGVKERGVPINMTDRHISYLPLPHIFERCIMGQILGNGGSVAFSRGDPTLLIEDIVACRPTFLLVVPRVLNKIYDKIISGIEVAGGFKKKLFYSALSTKTARLQRGQLQHGLYDKLIFNKIKAALGMDHVRLMVSGSAPLAGNIMIFFRCMLGIPVLEGYGQTEGAAGATLGHVEDMASVGNVGGPLDSCEILLMDVPDMGYFSSDKSHHGVPCQGRGEICIRGPNVFCGYYKDEEKTRETIDEEGWLYSGDIGLWTLSGNLQIIDRKKNIFKLAQGEYVAPEKIELFLSRSLFIGQIFVYGDSIQSYLVAVIVPDEEVVKKWARDVLQDSSEDNNQLPSMADLCKNEQLVGEILSDIKRLSLSSGLTGFEIVRAVHLEPEPFSVENGLLTPTFKPKRQQLTQRFSKELDGLYNSPLSISSKL